LEEENAKLKERLVSVQTTATSALSEKDKLKSDLLEAKASSATSRDSAVSMESSASSEELAALQTKIKGLQTQLSEVMMLQSCEVKGAHGWHLGFSSSGNFIVIIFRSLSFQTKSQGNDSLKEELAQTAVSAQWLISKLTSVSKFLFHSLSLSLSQHSLLKVTAELEKTKQVSPLIKD
jgi:hypothetical protein